MKKLHAIIDKTGNVTQVVVWDGVTEWAPSKVLTVVPCTKDVGFGHKWDGKQFVAPPVKEPTKEDLAAFEAMRANGTKATADSDLAKPDSLGATTDGS
jgi:hypothetical protein